MSDGSQPLRAEKVRTERLSTEHKRKTVATVNALGQIISKGFVFTNNFTAFIATIGFLKDNQIPYELIDGGLHWRHAVRRLDMEVGKNEARTYEVY